MNRLQIGARIPLTEAEGPGKRFAIWVQGCPLRCAGCCNPQFLPFEGGETISAEDLIAEILATPDIEGVTLIGGEPFAQAEALSPLAARVRGEGLSVMIFTGFPLEELREPAHQALLAMTDLLVDGPYRRDLPDRTRRWIGSTNQRIHFLSDRYRHLETAWPPAGNTIELRLRAGQLFINGFPDAEVTQWNRRAARPPTGPA